VESSEWLAVVAGCAAASITAIVWSWRNGAMLNYAMRWAFCTLPRRSSTLTSRG